MNDLKKKCIALGDLIYDILVEAKKLEIEKETPEGEVKRGRGRPKYDKELIAKEEAKAEHKADAILAPETVAPAVAEVLSAPEPDPFEEPVVSEATTVAPVKRTSAEFKQYMVTWYEADKDNRRPKVLGILNQITGCQKFADVTDEIATAKWAELVKTLG